MSRLISRATMLLAIALAFLFGAPRVTIAQLGTTTQIITGRVRGPDTTALVGARIELTSLSTGVVKHTTTHSDGRFSILFRDGGAQYRLRVTFIGMAPATLTLVQQPGDDRLVADVRLARTAVQLSAVQVRANATRNGGPPPSTAGSNERSLPQVVIERLPVGTGDLAAIAALAPGIVPVGATDSTLSSFSVSGQPANQNNTTVDGASFLFGSLPQDAVRGVSVVTNPYDVSRGQFTGGQVTSTTKSGTSVFQGTVTANRQQPSLQFPASQATTFSQRYTQTTGSFGVGGPLFKDQAFYFASMQYDRKNDPVTSLLDAAPAALANLGASPDSITRFLAIVGRAGLSGRLGAPLVRTSSTMSALTRLDWDLGDSHSLMIRGDLHHTAQDATRIAPLALPQTGGVLHSTGGDGMATLTSSIGDFINEARVYAAADHQDASGFLDTPVGAVTLTSDLSSADAPSRVGVSTLQFGGNPGLPRSTTTHLLEAGDELSWLYSEQHRFKIGALVNATRADAGVVPNRAGTFLYNSLADFDAGRPSLFARTLSGGDQLSGSNTGALYLGDIWRRSASFQMVYGLRGEVTTLPDAPAENAAVERAFGRRTDRWPTDTRLTPRFGFTYLLGNDGGLPVGVLSGGIGEFRGTIPSGLVAAVHNATGLAGSQVNLLCAGSGVPTPQWASYLADRSTIPSTCAGGAPSSLVATQPTVVLFDESFGAPAVWRGSLSYARRFHTIWSLNIESMFSYGVNTPFARDLNLPEASFALAGEAGRPVFARPTDIVPATGASALSSRADPQFGNVLSLGSGFRSRAGQVSATLFGPGLRSGGITSLSYTFNRVLDQSNGFGLGNSLPTTAGDPNVSEWGTSDLERRHQFVATVFFPVPHHLDVSLIGRLLSGPRYTPMVNGDVNGDGSRNDRAFVASTANSAALGPDIARLIQSTDGRAADCLRVQLGHIAGRNSCTTPWTPQIDVQMNWHPQVSWIDNRLMISAVATNTFAGADQLLHGDRLHGWGQPVVPDRVLYSITGFDPRTSQYSYRVNEHFGTPIGALSAFSLPFQIGLRARLTVGTDPSKAQLQSLTGGSNGGQASVTEVRDRILKGVPNPTKAIVDQADSLGLGLTPDQRAKLVAIASAYMTRADSLVSVIAKVLVDAGPNPDPGAIAPKIQGANLAVIGALQQSVKDAHVVLTPAQWDKLPDRIRLPLSQPAPAPAKKPPR